jgi:hypothetical protein
MWGGPPEGRVEPASGRFRDEATARDERMHTAVGWLGDPRREDTHAVRGLPQKWTDDCISQPAVGGEEPRRHVGHAQGLMRRAERRAPARGIEDEQGFSGGARREGPRGGRGRSELQWRYASEAEGGPAALGKHDRFVHFVPPERRTEHEKPEYDESNLYYDDKGKDDPNGLWGKWREDPLGLPNLPGISYDAPGAGADSAEPKGEQAVGTEAEGAATRSAPQALAEVRPGAHGGRDGEGFLSSLGGTWGHDGAVHPPRARSKGAGALPDLTGFGNPEALMSGYHLAGGAHPGKHLAEARERYVARGQREASRARLAAKHTTEGGADGDLLRHMRGEWSRSTLQHYEKHQNDLKTFV